MSTRKRPDNEYPVLLIHRGKHGDRYILATNNEEEELTWLAMFNAFLVLDSMYCARELVGSQLIWFNKACDGDAGAAQALLINRSGYEYEEVFTECIDTPLTMLEKLKDE